MAQRKSEETSPLDQVLKLVEQLSPEDREKLSQPLDGKSWGVRWRRLQQEIDENRIAKALPIMSEEEIIEEFRAHRGEQKINRAHSSD